MRRLKMSLVILLCGLFLVGISYRPKESVITIIDDLRYGSNQFYESQRQWISDSFHLHVPMGVFYYIWYDEGFGNRHWNDTNLGIVVDEPSYHSYYDSQNSTHVQTQIRLMKNAGIDFVIISWWGNNSYEDDSTKVFIDTDLLEGFTLKFCFIIEPFTESMNYSYVYDYIYENYAKAYPQQYFKWQNKPLLLWFNPLRPPKNDARFIDRVVGGSDYVDWYLWTVNPTIREDGEISIMPRFDDYYLWLYGGRERYMRYDENLTQGLYGSQWQYVIDYCSSVKLILIYSWNEYHERSQIEPHKDYTYPLGESYEYTQTIEFRLKFNEAVLKDKAVDIAIGGFIVFIVFAIVVKLLRR